MGDGHQHSHRVPPGADQRWLATALGLIGAFMAVEVLVGALANSLALLSDAAHMLTDAGSLALALAAMRLAARPPRGGYTYGLKRAEILSAQANGLILLLLAGWLGWAAVRRLVHPAAVAGGAVLATALAGVAVNVVAGWLISRADRSSLNVEGAYQHILTDLFAFAATATAGLVMLTTGFTRADGMASLLVVGLMVRAGGGLVLESGRIFLEGAPAGIDPAELGARLAEQPEVTEVHDLHVWLITSGQPAASAHVLVVAGGDCHAVRRRLEEVLRSEYGIAHSTLQVDHAGPAVLAVRRGFGPAGLEAGEAHCTDSHGPVHRQAGTPPRSP